MHGKSRRLVLIFLLLVLAPLGLGFAAFYVYDPLQVYHPTWGRAAKLHSNMRLQAAGMIRHADFDSVILGTSMTENTSADEASRLFGGRFANLSLTASDFIERSLVLDDLLRRRPVKRVIYTLDHIYINTRKGYPPFPMSTYEFLYDRNPFNDIRVYLNRHFATCLARWSDEEACTGRPATLDRANAWFREAEHAVRFGGIEKWCAARDNYQVRDAYGIIAKAVDERASGTIAQPTEAEKRERLDRSLRYIDDNLIRHVRDNPGTRFILIFPPYSRMTFAIWHQSKPLNSYLHQAVIRHLAGMSARLPNLEVYGFEDEGFPDDLANYKDLGHYKEPIDSDLLRAMAEGRHRLTGENVDEYSRAAYAKAMAFDLAGLRDRLAACGVGK